MKILRTIDDLSTTYEASKNKKILSEKDKTLSHFILKVDSSNAGYIITIKKEDSVAKFKMTIAEMYENGLTTPSKWFPYLLTYDDTNNIYLVVFEPEEPVEFDFLDIILVPSGTVSYSYTAGFIEDAEKVRLSDVKETLDRILSFLKVGR